MANKIRHGRSGQRLRPENMTHGPACDSLRGLALGRAWWKRHNRRLARRGRNLIVARHHGTPGLTTVYKHTGKVNKDIVWHNTKRPAHMKLRSHGWGVYALRPWARELENDTRDEADNDDVACDNKHDG